MYVSTYLTETTEPDVTLKFLWSGCAKLIKEGVLMQKLVAISACVLELSEHNEGSPPPSSGRGLNIYECVPSLISSRNVLRLRDVL